MTQRDQSVRHWRVAFVLLILVVTVATHLPQATPTENPVFESPDKLLHFICFGTLGFMFMCTGWIRSIVLSWFIMALWVFADEYTQDILPINRPFSLEDLIAGELGIYAAFCWDGALSKKQLQNLGQKVDAVLSSSKNWFILGLIAILVTAGVATALWFLSIAVLGHQESNVAIFIGFIIGAISVVLTVKKLGKIRSTILVKQKITMVWNLLGTIGIAVMASIFVQNSLFDPWVSALFILILGLRFTWAKAT